MFVVVSVGDEVAGFVAVICPEQVAVIAATTRSNRVDLMFIRARGLVSHSACPESAYGCDMKLQQSLLNMDTS